MPAASARAPDDLVEAVRTAVRRHRLLARGDHVLVAVSGGADSVALLHALTRLGSDHALELSVGHVHHGLRDEADRDAAFVRELAERLGCSVVVERVRVPRGAGQSPEEAARAVRYAALARMADAGGARRIALGHTADDQAETVLMRLLQGAGPRGLAGIPVRRGRLIRPLLEVDRGAVIRHLERHGLAWVEDRMNRDPKLLRNRIRHEMLPLLEAHGWPQVRAALRRTGRASRETAEALDLLLAPRAARLARPVVGGVALALGELRDLPPGAVKALLARALGPLRASHQDDLAGLIAAPVGAVVRLPGGVTVERGREALWAARAAPPAAPVPVAVPGETEIPGLDLRLHVDITPAERPVGDPEWEARFDADAVPGRLVIRAWQPGDRLVPCGGVPATRVSTLLARAGVPPAARRRWPLLVAATPGGETVLWAIGVRRAAPDAGPEGVRTVLRVRAMLRHGGEGGEVAMATREVAP